MTGLDIRHFPLILDVIDQGIFTVDGENRITSFNRAAAKITGFRPEDTIGRSCSEIFQTDHCADQCPLRQSIGSRTPVRRQEVRIHTREGRPLSTCVFAAPLVSASGELVGGIEVFHNLSDSKLPCMQKIDRGGAVEIVSRNPEMKRIIQQLQLVADSHSTLLITGDSGTGKEVVARAIHHRGPRQDKPLVAVNCAAMPHTLLESELFGYRKGAFTDAFRDNPGRIAKAEGGTLFLDEVGDLPVGLQVKLLRFLQERTYEPLGSSTPVVADVRVIAATNQDLERLVQEGRFRVDLFYRLNVFTIPLPALRHRTEDIPQLVSHFIRRFRTETGKPIDSITEGALTALLRYPWPGNIRELENAIEHAFILCQDFAIDLPHLPAYVATEATHGTPPRPGAVSAAVPSPGVGPLGDLERAAVVHALERHGGNRSAAARELGIHRTTLVRKLKRLALTG